jgi:hypothetical protein
MLALLLVAVAAQYNDPDPYVWMPVYLLPAALTVTHLAGRRVPWLLGLAFAGYLAAALYWSPALADATPGDFGTVAMRNQVHEQVREAGGLWLCALWTGALLWHGRRAPEARGA